MTRGLAQEWRLPPAGAIEYRRTVDVGGSAVSTSAAAARRAALDARLPERYFPAVVPAPWLCAGELTADRRRLTGPVRDLRDVLRALAFDLRGGGVRLRLDGVVPYGDVTVSGSWRVDAEGDQVFGGSITLRRPRGRLQAFCLHKGSGEVSLRRVVDPARGIVESFAGALDLVVVEAPRRFRRLQARDAWQFVAVRQNQDADFRARVAAAIDAGAAFVRRAIEGERSYLDGKVREQRSYGSGRLALALLTLLHARVPADDVVLCGGIEELMRRRLVDSYSLAAALMALARLAEVRGRDLTAAEQTAARTWLATLRSNVDPRTKAEDLLRFNYVRAPRYDTSVQQYGLLGLRAAQRCGLVVERGAFAAAARQLLAVQGAKTGRRALRTVTYAQLRDAGGREIEGRRRAALCRGFAYVDAGAPASGAMTAAGVSGLLLARAGIKAAGGRDRGLDRRIDLALRDGFAWLGANFSVRCNPGDPERGRRHLYYWLYCLERSCELARLARLDGRDWYYEGALQLLSQQRPDGGFRGGGSSLRLEATCFAVLFLAKAAGQAAVTGG